jgi:hypothetical protein
MPNPSERKTAAKERNRTRLRTGLTANTGAAAKTAATAIQAWLAAI